MNDKEPIQVLTEKENAVDNNDHVPAIEETVSEIKRRFRQCFGSVDGQRCHTLIDITDDKSKAYCSASCKNKKSSERKNPLLSTPHRIHKQFRRRASDS